MASRTQRGTASESTCEEGSPSPTVPQPCPCFCSEPWCAFLLRLSVCLVRLLWYIRSAAKLHFGSVAVRLEHLLAPTFNPRVPKRGKLRQVVKRPASSKNKEWQRVPYVRDPNAVRFGRADRHKWKRALPDLVKNSSASLVAMLRADGLLPKWEGALCPHCHRGCQRRKSRVPSQSTGAASKSARNASTLTMLTHCRGRHG